MSRSGLKNAAAVRRIAAAIGASALVAMAVAAVADAQPVPNKPMSTDGATTTSTVPPTAPLTPSASPVVKATFYGKG